MLKEELKKVPVYDKQELLSFITTKNKSIHLHLVSNSGQTYNGILLNMAPTKKEGTVLLLQTIDYNNRTTGNILHISLDKIESIQFLENEDMFEVLSKGSIMKSKEYKISGKLQVKKTLKKLSDSIMDLYNIEVGIPEIVIPSDGKERNRIIQSTKTIQQVIIDILKEEDARESWQAKYNHIQFINDQHLMVKQKDHTLIIQFAFTDITALEIKPKELMDMIICVL